MGVCLSKATAIHPASPARGAARLAGEALLGVAKELPWIAPVAFLIGAVVKAAQDAAALKEDARSFVRVVHSVDGVLQRAALDGKLDESAKEPVALVREALEEALSHCHKLARRGTAVAMLLSGKDSTTFDVLQTKLHRACDLLALACSADTNLLVRESYDQATRLSKEVEEAGGVAAVVADPKLRERIASSSSTMDQIVVATVTNDISATQLALTKLLEKKFSAQESERAARYDAMEQHLKTLTTMIQAVAQFRGDPEEKGGFEADARYVQQLATPAIYNELTKMMPVAAREPARLVAVDDVGLTGDELKVRIANNEEIHKILAEVLAIHDSEVAFMTVTNKDKTTFIAGEFRDTDANAIVDGISAPREITQCQHVIATGNRDILLAENHDVIDMMGPEALAIGKVHAGFDQFQAVGARIMDEAVPDDERISVDAPATIGGFRKIFAIHSSKGMRYRGVPVKVCGENVCTLCTMGKGKGDVKDLEALAAKAGRILEAQRDTMRPAPTQATDVRSWLTARRLGTFADGLSELGVEVLEDLHDVSAEDCAGLGMTHIQQNRFRRALGTT